MKIRALTVAILLIVIILGGVLILKVSGLWVTEGSKVPTKITTGEFSGVSNPADIRGSYTFEDININFNIPAEITAKAFSVNISNEEAKSFQAKELELIYGELEDVQGDIGTDSIKLFVSLYLGIPFTAEEDTYLPSTAIELLLQEGKITQEEFTELSKRSYNIQTIPTIEKVEIEQDSPPIDSGEIEIKGNTTFNDLISWGLTTDEIEKVIDGPIASKTMTIRDAATQHGAEFSVYKNSLQDVLNNK